MHSAYVCIQGTPRGTVVLRVQATDPDTGPAGQLEYSFYRNPGLEEDTTYFSIDPSTGAISVAKDLDYEKKKEYTVGNQNSIFNRVGYERGTRETCKV